MNTAPLLDIDYWRERAREACPSLAADQLDDAAGHLAALYDADTVGMETQYVGPWQDSEGVWRHTVATSPYRPVTPESIDPRAFDGRRGGGVPDHSAAPDAWSANVHTVKVGRGKKGPTRLVVGRTVAPVIGRTDVDAYGRPILATPADGSPDVACASWAAAQMLTRGLSPDVDDTDRVHRMRIGVRSIDVQRIADRAYALDVAAGTLPALLGTDAMAWDETVRADRSQRSTVSLSGLGAIAAQSAANGTQTVRLSWPTRYRITVRRRKSDPTTITEGNVTHLVAPAATADRLFIGHRAIDRGQTVTVARRQARNRRTVATVEPPETVGGWQALVDHLNRGDRIVAGPVTITRDAHGFYAFTDKRDSETFKGRARTSQSVALKLAR